MKRFLSTLLAVCMVLLLPISAFAEGETIVASGQFGAQGDNLTWSLDSEGTLTISGAGEMGNSRPWSPFNGATIHSHNIKNVRIGNGITTIGDSIFFDCRNLQSVTLPDGLLSIDDLAFWECSSLTQIDIPHTVTTIGEEAFRGCVSLTSVTIPSGVTALGRQAFLNCFELRDLTIKEGVTDIRGAFQDCKKLSQIDLPSTIVNMDSAFSCCDSLTSIRIPASVKIVGEIPFYFCTSLTEIIVDEGNTAYTDVDGVLFTKDITKLVAYPIGNTRTTYTIPDGVTEIDYGAFIHGINLTSICIPASITTIGCNATFECHNLKDVYYTGTREQWEQIQFCILRGIILLMMY